MAIILKNKLAKIIRILILIISFLIILLIEYILFNNFSNNLLYSKLLLAISILFLLLIFDSDYRQIALMAFLFMIICPILILFYFREFSNFIALNIPIFMLSAAILYLVEYKKNFDKNYLSTNKFFKNLKPRKIFSFVFLLFFISFILITFLSNQKDFSMLYQRIIKRNTYFQEIENIKLDGNDYQNKTFLKIEIPSENDVVSGYFTIEGWAADISEIPGSKIDYVLIYVYEKPENGGKFVCKCNYGKLRTDIGKSFGDNYNYTGYYYRLDSRQFRNGINTFYVYIHSNNFGWKFETVDLIIDN